MTYENFVNEITGLGQTTYRDMPWRQAEASGSFDVYKILVSELMLQQTQVTRVIPKYEEFIAAFPTISRLANATLADVLRIWSGLGYNRRAKYLHDAAKTLSTQKQPYTFDTLVSCKGIGSNTASAVVVYAYNTKAVFVETNIRTVFIHYFFAKQSSVTDKEIIDALEKSLKYVADYRSWYWSLMDVGTRLKSEQNGHLAKASTYKKQPIFTGSRRQLRGRVIKQLLDGPKTYEFLQQHFEDVRLDEVLEALVNEKIITIKNGFVTIV